MKEVAVSSFIKNGNVVKVNASIGSLSKCKNSDNPNNWGSYIQKHNISEIRHYHNHPTTDNYTQPSDQDYITCKNLKAILGENAAILRSFIVFYNKIGEWRIIEYTETGKWWLVREFDASKVKYHC